AAGAEVLGPKAVVSRWKAEDGAVLTIAVNLADAPVAASGLAGPVLFESSPGAAEAAADGSLPGYTTVALLERAA
ncbi:DUF3459 domain-containing protein, partial [Hansschlegelia beijingensis]